MVYTGCGFEGATDKYGGREMSELLKDKEIRDFVLWVLIIIGFIVVCAIAAWRQR